MMSTPSIWTSYFICISELNLQLPFPSPSPMVHCWELQLHRKIQQDGSVGCMVGPGGSFRLCGGETSLDPHRVTSLLPRMGGDTHPCSPVRDNFLRNLTCCIPHLDSQPLDVLAVFWNALGYLNRYRKRNIQATIVIWSSASFLSFCSSDVLLKQQSGTWQTAGGLYPQVPGYVISGLGAFSAGCQCADTIRMKTPSISFKDGSFFFWSSKSETTWISY